MNSTLKTLTAAAVVGSFFSAPSWTAAHAQANFTPPTNCSYGRQSVDFSLPELAFYVGETGEEIDQDEEHLQSVVNLIEAAVESFDYLRIESDKYVLRNQNFRVKGNLFDILRYVRFHNSELGYVGQDKSNLEANAYLNMKFPRTRGPAVVWITGNDLCSMASVFVQDAPEISNAAVTTGQNRLDFNVTYAIDEWSRAAMETSVHPRITFRLRSDTFGTTQTVSFNGTSASATRNFTVNPDTGGGGYRIWMTVGDGTYSTTQDLGFHFVTGGHTPPPPCPLCSPL